MSFSRLAENRIREAMAEGKFDKLSGAGAPVDLEEYFRTPEDLRMAYSILKNARCAPAEVELLNEIARLTDAIGREADAAERETLQRALVNRRTHLAMLLERAARPRA